MIELLSKTSSIQKKKTSQEIQLLQRENVGRILYIFVYFVPHFNGGTSFMFYLKVVYIYICSDVCSPLQYNISFCLICSSILHLYSCRYASHVCIYTWKRHRISYNNNAVIQPPSKTAVNVLFLPPFVFSTSHIPKRQRPDPKRKVRI